MKQTLSFIVWSLLIVFIAELFFLAALISSINGVPGNRVARLENTTTIINGAVCQVNTPGFYSLTGPDGEKDPTKLNRLLFPTVAYVSFIADDGTTSWENANRIVKIPSDTLQLCPSPE